MNIPKNIKAIRLEKGINQEIIADAIGFDTSNYSRIENGKQELKANQLADIAKALDVDITYLLTYPKKYVDIETYKDKYDKVSITFEVSPEKRDYLLSLLNNKK